MRTFQSYAGLTFLGYIYAEDDTEALIKTRKKFGNPKAWGIEEYDVRQIHWEFS